MKLSFAVLTFLVFAVDFGQLEKSNSHGANWPPGHHKPHKPHHHHHHYWNTTVLDPTGSEVAQVYSSIESDITSQLIPMYEHITLEPVKEAVRLDHFVNKTVSRTFYELLVPIHLENNGTKHSACFEAVIRQDSFIGKPVYNLFHFLENRKCKLNYPHNGPAPTRKPHLDPIVRKQLNPRGEESRRVYEGVKNQMESQLTNATFYLPELPSKVFSFTKTYMYPVKINAFKYELIVMVKVAKSSEQRRFVAMVSRKVKHGDTVFKLDSFHETEDKHPTPAPKDGRVFRKILPPRGLEATLVYTAAKKDITKIMDEHKLPKYPSEMAALYRGTTRPIWIRPFQYDMVLEVRYGREMFPTPYEVSVSTNFTSGQIYKVIRFEKMDRSPEA